MLETSNNCLNIQVIDMQSSFAENFENSISSIDQSTIVSTYESVEEFEGGGFDKVDSADAVLISENVPSASDLIHRLSDFQDTQVVLLVDPDSEDNPLLQESIDLAVSDWFVRSADTATASVILSSILSSQQDAGSGDLTARTLNGEQLRDERDRRSILYENNPDPIVVVRLEVETPVVDEVNAEFTEVFGRDESEIVGRSIKEVLVPDDKSEEYHHYRRRTIRGERTEAEVRRETEDGVRDFLMKIIPFDIGDGPQNAYVWYTDITERKRQARQFEEIFHGVQDPITIHDRETAEVLRVNDSFCDLLGYDREEIVEMGTEGYSVTELGYTTENAREFVQDVVESGEEKQTEWAVETAEGEIRWLEVNGTTAEIGGELRYISIDRDITERKRTEERLETITDRIDELINLVSLEIPEYQEAFLEYSGDFDSLENLNAESLYRNSSYTDLFSEPAAQLEDDPFALLRCIHSDDVPQFKAKLEEMLLDMKEGYPDVSYQFSPYRVIPQDGEERWVETTAYPISTDGITADRYVNITNDVTDRIQREETLQTFHEATRELTEATSKKEASQLAVDAAQHVLDLPLVSIYLFDDEEGMLEPAAKTSRLASEFEELDPFPPGDSLPWQVFVDGEARKNSDTGRLSPDTVFPLGSHGVMMMGTSTETVESEDIELAQILAATLEAALNHVAGERELEERERQLKNQQERAEQLENLNSIIRSIEQATVTHSSRADIESAVCERLMEADAHDVVWISEPTLQEDELVPRSIAGDDQSYVSAVEIPSENTVNIHPAAKSYLQEEPFVAENIAEAIGSDGWQKTALRYGIQSVIAVPIQYQNTVHGTLTIASDAPYAFDQSTEEVLTELANSIGHAVTVSERERALQSEGRTEVEFSITDESLWMVLATQAEDCEISFERTVRRNDRSFSTYYSIKGTDPEALVRLEEQTPTVEGIRVVNDTDGESAGLVEVESTNWFGSLLTDHGAVVREATATDGKAEIVVEAPLGTRTRLIFENLKEAFPSTELVAQRQREGDIQSFFEIKDVLKEEMTQRQWEVFQTAYSTGYFEWPRETSGSEVASILDITQPTFNKHLRLAERKAVEVLMEEQFE